MRPRDETDRLRLLYDLACAFAGQMEIETLIPFVIRQCRDVLDAGGASVLFFDRSTNELYFPYVTEDDPEAAAQLLVTRFPANQGIAGAVVQSAKPIHVEDAQHDPRFYPGVDARTGATTRNILAAPLTSRNGTIGVLQVINRRDGGTFGEEDLAFLETFAASVAVAIENARLYTALKVSEERLRSEVGALRREVVRSQLSTEMVGTGAPMAEVARLMESAAASPIAVLIEGETGTGKELAARLIHRASPRAEASFLAVNCAALPETLLESELFGHRRGAFTGASQDRRGLFEAASGGTIFLDEIGEMPPPMQAKLLRVLQEGEVTPVGDTHPRKVDVRVISATNRDLVHAMREGRFREDLYYRLAAFPIRLPPLRERREDVPILADRFLAAAAERHHKRIPGIAPAAVTCFMRFDWPGNVRELQNELERAVALARDGDTIDLGHLSRKLTETERDTAGAGAKTEVAGEPAAAASAPDTHAAAGSLQGARAAFEARYIAQVLHEHGGNVSRAAQALGVSRVALHRKMKEYGLR
ncbi:MAG: sigma 54-interacting transcriptional regulator [Deltaproteobacteria bacterium]|nr:sigma 54-interacting transcriptional regulator [Deltaproteobacteria bacterium]